MIGVEFVTNTSSVESIAVDVLPSDNIQCLEVLFSREIDLGSVELNYRRDYLLHS